MSDREAPEPAAPPAVHPRPEAPPTRHEAAPHSRAQPAPGTRIEPAWSPPPHAAPAAPATRLEPVPGARVGPAPATTVEPAPGTRIEPQTSPADPPAAALPAPLRGRFTMVRRLGQGSEAEVLLVRDGAGRQLVVKHYRPEIALDDDVTAAVAALRSPHTVALLESGRADGRSFGVLEYLPSGDLRGLIAQTDRRLPAALITEVVRQLHAALSLLHGAGIVHRDLKPDNILVRRLFPVELAVTDFGISRRVEMTTIYSNVALTLAYAAPESLAGVVSRPVDWWSLGMIVRELVTGQQPFAGIDERVVRHHLMTRPVDLAEVDDPRLRMLCQGLLCRNERLRWGETEVAAWLAGQSPAVPEDAYGPAVLSGSDSDAGSTSSRPAGGPAPLVFGGTALTDRAEAARAFARDEAAWVAATQRYLTVVGTHGQVGEGWRALRDWLPQFDGPDGAEARIELVDRYLLTDLPPDLKLLHLLRWLDPELPPNYRGRLVTPEALVALAGNALAGNALTEPGAGTAPAELIRAIAVQGALPLLARFAGGAELAGVDIRWRELLARWDHTAAYVRDQVPALAQAVPPWPELPWVCQALLLVCLRPDRVEALREFVTAAADEIDARVSWFHGMTAHLGDDPVRLVMAAHALGPARTDSERVRLQDDRVAATWEARRQGFADFDQQRRAGRRRALGWMAAGAVILGVAWLAIAAAVAGTDPMPAYLLIGAALGVQVAAEAAVASTLAGAYHPRWSLAGALGRLPGRIWRRIGAIGRAQGTMGCLGVLGGCCLYPVVAVGAWLGFQAALSWPATTLVLPPVLALWFTVWSAIRYRGWRRVHRQLQQEWTGR